MRRTATASGIALSLFAVIVGPANLDAADNDKQYTLRYKFETGQSVSYQVDSKSRVHLQKGQGAQDVEHGSLTDKRYIVSAVDGEGNADLKLQIDRVRMSAEVVGGASIAYDSDSGEEPPTSLEGVAETIGKPQARVKVTPTGNLLAIDWLIGVDNTNKPTVKDEASLDILVVLPPEPIVIGETWKQPFEVQVSAGPKLNKSVKLQREYTLTAVDGDRATIRLKTTVITPLHDPRQECQIIGKLLDGAIVFDLNRGVVVSRSVNVDRMVVGFEGPNSKIHNVSNRTEKLVPPQIAAEATGDAVRK